MSASVLATFIATCVLLAVTPGPNMALIISSTLSGGLGTGLATLLGCMTGLAILVTVAAVGMTSVMLLLSEWFDVVRWVGAIYLVLLGSRQLWSWWRTRRAPRIVLARSPGHERSSAIGRFLQGLAISLSNPKVLLFLGAFFPQFVDPQAAPGPQLAILACIFVGVLTAVDASYTVAIARARAAIDLSRLRTLDTVSGFLLVSGGLALAAARRP